MRILSRMLSSSCLISVRTWQNWRRWEGLLAPSPTPFRLLPPSECREAGYLRASIGTQLRCPRLTPTKPPQAAQSDRSRVLLGTFLKFGCVVSPHLNIPLTVTALVFPRSLLDYIERDDVGVLFFWLPFLA